ncbi:TPA: hypothetical protein ACT1UX_002085 [Raoultella planticola]
MKTDITELAQREKFEAWFVNDVVGADVTFPGLKDGEYVEGEIYDEQLYFMLQAMWMAWKSCTAEMVEAVEKAQQRIDELLPSNRNMLMPALGGLSRDHLVVTIQTVVDNYSALHTKWLEDRQRIADLESRTVTVKLPDNCEHDVIAPVSAFMYGVGFEIDTEDYNSLAGRVRSEIETVVRRTLRTAGIKWEAE